MKKIAYLTICGFGLLLAACSSKNKSEKEGLQVVMQDSVAIEGPQRMQVSDAKVTITFKGKEYESTVVRRPDENLPVVKNEQGEMFVDNSITLRITCAGKTVVDRVFTKESFTTLVDARFMSHAILEGLVFNKTTPQGMIYAASICYPQTDLYVPVRLTVTADGHISMEKEELLEDVYETDSVN